jgi:hypothetical protein
LTQAKASVKRHQFEEMQARTESAAFRLTDPARWAICAGQIEASVEHAKQAQTRVDELTAKIADHQAKLDAANRRLKKLSKAADVEPISIEAVRTLLQNYINTDGACYVDVRKKQVCALMRRLGTDILSNLDPKHYNTVVQWLADRRQS